MKLESNFQRGLIKELKEKFPNCMIYKLDPTYIQGSPDLLILEKDKWAALEVKVRKSASHRPNQDYYINKLNNMSYAAFVYPENKEDIIHDLEQAFGSV